MWRRTSRATSRENSVIHWLECADCRQGIVAKLPLIAGSALCDRRRAEFEYQTLLELQSRFQQSDQYGTLIPVAYLEEFGILVTRRFDGYNMMRHLHQPRHPGLMERCHDAGTWLRRLHDACPQGYADASLDVDGRINYLEQTYGILLAHNRIAHIAYKRLIGVGSELKTSLFRGTWSHGDFKPENLLYDGYKYVGIDTMLKNRGAVLYDIASFLDHLLLDGRTLRHRYVQRSFEQAVDKFVVGYCGLDDSDRYAIRWLQMYFMLCYWGRSQGRSRLRALYGNWQILPLLREIELQL